MRTLAFVGLLGFAAPAYAAEPVKVDPQPDTSPHYGLGFAAGPITGVGIAGRVMSDRWAGQMAFLPYYTPSYSLFAGGLTGFYTLNRGQFGALYASLGGGALTRSYDTSVPVDPINPCPVTGCQYTTVRKTETGFAVGPGIGLEFQFASNFIFTVDLPFAFMFDVADKKVAFKSLTPIPDASLLYRF